MVRAICCGYYGEGNGGDEALLASLLQMLPDTVEAIALSGNPSQTETQYGVQTGDRRNAFQVLKVLRAADWFIWGGGSLIQDVTSTISPLYYTGLMGLAQQMGLTTIAWSQGIGPLQRPITRAMAKRAFSGCNLVTVRDSGSAALLTDWQIPFTLAPDPVWALDPKPVPGLWDFPAPRVAVTWRSHPLLTPKRLEILTRALVSFQQATDTYILLVPFQLSQDLVIAELIHKAIPYHSQILKLTDPQMLRGLFQGVEMAISMRLHSLIMAASQECRCFAISYDPKVSHLMAELDFPGWELSQIPDDANIISKAWIEHYANGDRLDPVQIESLSDRAQVHGELLQSLINS